MAATENVLILGGVGSIGEALARRLSSKGFHVCVPCRSLDGTSALAREAGAMPGLAYCIGRIPPQSLAGTTSELMLDADKLNVFGAMLAVRAAASSLRTAAGSG
jgi:nucleoside-diphosphate-sugar epimerase